MINKNFIQEEISSLITLEAITRAYSQIASIRMKNVRNLVLSSRDFLNEISFVFAEVLESYRKEAEALAKKRKGKGITFLAHNGRSVAVFMSANTGLYGDLIVRTFNRFLNEIRNSDSEVVVVGKLGLSMFKKEEPNRAYTFFELDDVSINQSDMASMIKHLVQYEQINVYYPKFKNAILQEPTTFRIAAGEALPGRQKEVARTNYWFEPSVENILIFFETEIFASLIAQSVSESQLAKFASRIISLDVAGEKIRLRNKEMLAAKLVVSHRIANRKQLHSITGMSLWKGGILFER